MSHLNSVTCWTDCGETWSTSVSKETTEQDAIGYFLGQTFNIGDDENGQEDKLVLVTAILYRKGA